MMKYTENEIKALVDFSYNYDLMMGGNRSYNGRRSAYERMLNLYVGYDCISDFFSINNGKYFMKDRVVANPCHEPLAQFFMENHDAIVKLYAKEAPVCCLYMIGMISIDPDTMLKKYMVKVGRTENLDRRLYQYHSANPGIRYVNKQICSPKKLAEREKACHAGILAVSQTPVKRTKEWFEVTPEQYERFCNNGFKELLIK